ncbi:ectonucleoside triphosphate diphosphohydrolase 1 isoform X1 [Stegostoma tigrinum]|uniref:ectonucleoside triphosphate diphosphohydrolase 1 isoform X1 n=1 Tax=Stegostoma tigrinum TaxID=3053191 RepID=UPI0028700718|nr:ectonucleoside triphosphate diphosphohydrolase 1 isoform X1 [Stegostoma tigrinum]
MGLSPVLYCMPLRAENRSQFNKIKLKKHRYLIALIITLMVAGVVILVTISVVQNKSLPKKLKYGIVLDAGSSHTALYIYSWPAEKLNDTGIVTEVDSCKVKGPGISSYWNDIKQAGLSLKMCLEKAKERIPEKQQHVTPVYLGATAGMRLLRLQDQFLAEKLMNSVEEFIKTYPFNFQGVKIITGQEEGVFGWITVNYLKENIGKDNVGGNPETLGALDLGGASTQITFVPDGKIESEESALHIRLYGKSYNIYTHSYLCYGKDQALKLLLEKLNASDDGTVLNPCFNKGYTRTINVTAFFDSPCTSIQHSTTHQIVTVIGTGSPDQCSHDIRSIFNFSVCTWSSCSFDGVYQPKVHGKFGAFSAYYFVMDFFNLTNEKPYDLSTVKHTVMEFCSKPWGEVRNSFSINEKYLSENCFAGQYILSLLQNGYNFTSSNWETINFLRKIKGTSAGWTLGYMMNLTNMIPAEPPYTKPLTNASYLTAVIIISIFLFFLLVTGFLIFRKKVFKTQNKP